MLAIATAVAVAAVGIAAPSEAAQSGSERLWRFERVGEAVTQDGAIDRGPYSKLAPWPTTDREFLYSGCYPRPPRADDVPGFDRCFMTVDLSNPIRPVRAATIHSYDREESPAPPHGHPVWSPRYPFANLPVRVPCKVEWQDSEIVAGRRAPACWDPGWNTHTHYVALGDNRVLAVNQERHRAGTNRQANYRGIKFYDIRDPRRPEFLSYWEAPSSSPDPASGVNRDSGGAHHFNFAGRYLYVGTEYAGYVGKILVVLDVANPLAPVEVARWWAPGQKTQEEDDRRDWIQQPRFSNPIARTEQGPWTKHVGMHYAVVEGRYAYLSYHQLGLVILDVADVRNPRLVSHTNYLLPGADPTEPNAAACMRAAGGRPAACGNTHSARTIPGRDLLVVSDEYFTCPFGHVRVFDISNHGAPRLLSHFLTDDTTACAEANPRAPANAAGYPIRNPSAHIGIHWDANYYLMAWYGRGLEVIDLRDPAQPKSAGSYRYSIDAEWTGEDPTLAGADTYDVVIGPGGYLYLSDGTSGLRVVRPQLPRDP